MHVDRICFQAQLASVCDQRLDFIEENEGRTVLSVFSDRPTEQLRDSFLRLSQRGALQGMRLNFQIRQLLRFEQPRRLRSESPGERRLACARRAYKKDDTMQRN